jgi:hypothetical protein
MSVEANGRNVPGQTAFIVTAGPATDESNGIIRRARLVSAINQRPVRRSAARLK